MKFLSDGPTGITRRRRSASCTRKAYRRNRRVWEKRRERERKKKTRREHGRELVCSGGFLSKKKKKKKIHPFLPPRAELIGDGGSIRLSVAQRSSESFLAIQRPSGEMHPSLSSSILSLPPSTRLFSPLACRKVVPTGGEISLFFDTDPNAE